MNRAVRRQKKRISAQQEKKAASPTPQKTQNSASQKKYLGISAQEHFINDVLNMGFGVFGVGAAPLAAHLAIFALGADPEARFQQDAYLLALSLWGGTFYEVRCTSKKFINAQWLRIYNMAMHWMSPIFAFAMAFAYAFLAVKPKSTYASVLAKPLMLGVLLIVAIAGYLTLKLPILWAEARESVEKSSKARA